MDMQRNGTPAYRNRDYGFVLGMLTGTFVGAGLAVWLAPRLAGELRARVMDAAKVFGERAADQFRQATNRVQDVRDEVAGAVARGAHEVERVATAAKSDRH